MSSQNALTAALNSTMKPTVKVVDIDGGLDSKTDPRKVAIPKTTIAQDVIYTTPGEVRKRPGFGVFTSTLNNSSLSMGYNAGSYKYPGGVKTLFHGQIAGQNQPGLLVVNPQSVNGGLLSASPNAPWNYVPKALTPSPNVGSSQTNVLFAVQSTGVFGILMYFNVGPFNSVIQTIDMGNGAVVNTSITAGQLGYGTQRLVANSAGGFVYATSYSSSTFKTYSITLSATGVPTITAGSTITTQAVSSPLTYSIFDMVNDPTHGVLVAFTNGANLVVNNLTNAGVVSGSFTYAYSSSSIVVNVCLVSNGTCVYAFFLFQFLSGLQCGFWQSVSYNGTTWAGTSNNVFSGSSPFSQVGPVYPGGNCCSIVGVMLPAAAYYSQVIFYCSVFNYGSPQAPGITICTTNFYGSNATTFMSDTPGSAFFPYSAALGTSYQQVAFLAKPIALPNADNSYSIFLPVGAHPDTPTGFLLNQQVSFPSSQYYSSPKVGGAFQVVTRFNDANLSAAPFLSYSWPVANLVYQNSNFYFTTVNLTGVISGSAYVDAQLITIAPNTAPPMPQIETTTYIPGGILSVYAGGSGTIPAGFDAPPPVPALSAVTGTTSLSAGTYYYKTVYRMYDTSGLVYMSEPSTSASITITSGQYVNVSVYAPMLPVGYLVFIDIYRTTIANAGATFYYVTSLQCQTGNTQSVGGGFTYSSNGYYANTPSNNFLSDSTSSDTAIAGNASLYTGTGNAYHPNHPAPAFTYLASGLGRLWGISSLNPNRIYFSDAVPQAPTGTALNWYRSNYIEIPADDGGATSIQVMDTNLVVFTTNKIYIVNGPGPGSAGPTFGAATFSQPVAVASSTGCSAPNSVALLPIGTIFQSRQGMMLLNRSLQTQYMPDPDSFASSQTYSRTIVMPEYQTVIWLAPGTGNTAAGGLAYNYEQNKWSVLTGFNGVGIADGVPGSWYMLRSNGTYATAFTSGVFQDNGTLYYPMSIETPWIQLGSPTGWGDIMEMQVLGEYKSPHTLNIQVAYDYGPYLPTPLTTNTATALVNGDTVYQFRYHMPKRNRCYAVRFLISDTPTAGAETSGESCRISGLVLHLAADAGLSRLAAAKSG